MSTPLALSAVTSLLQTCLGLVYNSSALGTVHVSAVAPDVVESKYGIGADSGLRVNLFLHQVTPNSAWRNIELPSLAASCDIENSQRLVLATGEGLRAVG